MTPFPSSFPAKVRVRSEGNDEKRQLMVHSHDKGRRGGRGGSRSEPFSFILAFTATKKEFETAGE